MAEGPGIAFASTGGVARRGTCWRGRRFSTLFVSADREFATRVADRFPVRAVPRCLVLYRAHDAPLPTEPSTSTASVGPQRSARAGR